MNRGFFNLSDGCRGNQENNVFAVTIATNQRTKNDGLILCILLYPKIPKNFRANQQVVIEKKCRKCQILNFEKNGFKVKLNFCKV